MCGIAGAVGPITDRVLDAVSRAHDALQHRGPDAAGQWHHAPDGNGVALAHRRLAIIDLSADGAQPMRHAPTGNAIAFNGEIYNYRALRDELKTLGHAFHTQTDTEVILAAYAQWGADCLDRFNGMFAFALWDKAKQTCLLARDRLGIKPLYYTHHNGTLLFASELRALLATQLIPRTLDPAALSTYLWNGFVVGPNTIIDGVRLLPAGSHATVDATGQLSPIDIYWRQPIAGDTHTDTDELRDALEQSVSLRLVADVPLGVFLSGGVDSSALAALAARVSDRPVQTFNISFDEPEFDESPYALRVAEAIRSEHHDIRLTEQRFAAQLDDALVSIDQPTFDAINTYFVSRAVREAGLTVALAGTGGDELFGGYASFHEVPRSANVARCAAFIPGPIRRALAAAVARIKTGKPGAVKPQTRWGKLADALDTRGNLLAMYQVSYGLFTHDFLDQLTLHTNAHTHYGLTDTITDDLTDRSIGSDPLTAVSRFEQTLFLGQRLLRDTDAASMAVALEARVPLLDHHIIEALAKLDPQTRFHPLGRKQLLRDLALGDVDPTIFDRPKSGFVLPLDVWCRRKLDPVLDDTFNDERLCTSVGLNPKAVGRLWSSYTAGAPGLYWSRVWALYVLLNWCRTHGVSL